MLKNFLIGALCALQMVHASGPGIPPDADEESQFVLVGKPSKVSQRYFYKSKEYSLVEVKKFFKDYDERWDISKPKTEAVPRIQVEYTVVIEPIKIHKGAIISEKLQIKWRDLYDSMCPHIPSRAFTNKGIWYLGSHVKKGEHDHAVYWMDFSENNLQAILGKEDG